MPADRSLDSVQAYRTLIAHHLERLDDVKRDGGIEPPLTEVDCKELVLELQAGAPNKSIALDHKAHYTLVDTVFRQKFYSLLSSRSIDSPSFTPVWNLLDVVAILSDYELCEPALIFWLVEELLDSQRIDGCRKVFDYLESRREQITAKHFNQKHLVILRSCNELLRRLSRAEDTVFCGRVFIFLFQSFPLGDKSSVNLRGEFHVENVTTYDEVHQRSADAIEPMGLEVSTNEKQSDTTTPAATSAVKDGTLTQGKEVAPSVKDNQPPDLDALYPIFWAMQANFSSPIRLFQAENLKSFKGALSATLDCFQKVHSTASTSTNRLDDGKRGAKRKRSGSGTGTEFSNSVHTKYLTNRDLFDLEVHDIAFRRHILVQALIILDFLLSLTPAAKQKLSHSMNKAVLYSFTLSDDDATWALATKSSIASYLQQGNGNEGKFYYRMVDTVLSRDKNWVRWKADSCPSIDRAPIPGKEYLEAQQKLQRICAKQTLPPPPGAAELKFLSQTTSLESLKHNHQLDPTIPKPETFYKGIKNDELDAEMGDADSIKIALEAKASKLWRALRASKNKFALCERIENGNKMEALLEDEVLAVDKLETTELTEPTAPVSVATLTANNGELVAA